MKTVFFDVDTQLDFLMPAGALYVPGAETIIEGVGKLNQHAAKTGSVVISTMDAHRENDEEFHHWPPHCIYGTLGQHKLAATVLPKQVIVPVKEQQANITGAQQIVIQKYFLDPFRNPNLQPILDLIAADRYVLYGVVTEICVEQAAAGLFKTGKRVELVEDAVRSLDQAQGEATLKSFAERGGVLTRVSEIVR